MKYRDYFTECDEEELLRFESHLTRLSSAEIESLYDHLIQLCVDQDLNINDTILDSRVSIKGSNLVEFSGTGEHSSQESAAYLDIYLDNILLGELVFYSEQRFASEGYITSLEFIEEETALAKLSERVQDSWGDCGKPITQNEQTNDLKTNTQENTTMAQFNTTNSLRTLNLNQS